MSAVHLERLQPLLQFSAAFRVRESCVFAGPLMVGVRRGGFQTRPYKGSITIDSGERVTRAID